MSDLAAFKAKFLRLLELREDSDEKEAAAKKAKKAYKDYEVELYSELEDAGIKGRLVFDFGPEIGTVKFQRAATVYGSVVDRFAAIEALRKAGLGHVIATEKFEDARINELVRDRLESKQDLPDGIDFYTRKRISISRK